MNPKNARHKKTIRKMPLFCLLVDWTQLRKKCLNLRIAQWQPPKTEKSKENQREKKRTKYPRTVRQILKVKHIYNQNFRRRKEGTGEIFETIMKGKFS